MAAVILMGAAGLVPSAITTSQAHEPGAGAAPLDLQIAAWPPATLPFDVPEAAPPPRIRAERPRPPAPPPTPLRARPFVSTEDRSLDSESGLPAYPDSETGIRGLGTLDLELRTGIEIPIGERWALRLETAPLGFRSKVDRGNEDLFGHEDLELNPANVGFGLSHNFFSAPRNQPFRATRAEGFPAGWNRFPGQAW